MRSLLFEPDYRQVMCNCVAVLNPKLRYVLLHGIVLYAYN